MDGCVRCYDLRKGLAMCDDLHRPLTAFSLVDETLVTLSTTDSALVVYDRSACRVVRELQGHTSAKMRVAHAVGAGKDAVLSGSEDGSVVGWQLLGVGAPRLTRSKQRRACTSQTTPSAPSTRTQPCAGRHLARSTARLGLLSGNCSDFVCISGLCPGS